MMQTIRYALSYGATATKVASILKCSKKEGEIQVENFYNSNLGLKLLIDYLKIL